MQYVAIGVILIIMGLLMVFSKMDGLFVKKNNVNQEEAPENERAIKIFLKKTGVVVIILGVVFVVLYFLM